MDYFYNPDIVNGSLHLNEEETSHCIRVLRKKPGDKIIVIDGQGGIYTCILSQTESKQVKYEIYENVRISPPHNYIHIAIAPTKNIDRIEWFIEKSIEVGVRKISFIQCENSERKKINMDRMLKKAISALKQSQNSYLPYLHDLVSVREFIKNADPDSVRLICHADRGKGSFLLEIIDQRLEVIDRGTHYLVMVGPEGDFTSDELIMAEDAGFKPVSLGPARLRTETAGLVACILLNSLNTQV